jgi:hypothetical protein
MQATEINPSIPVCRWSKTMYTFDCVFIRITK